MLYPIQIAMVAIILGGIVLRMRRDLRASWSAIMHVIQIREVRPIEVRFTLIHHAQSDAADYRATVSDVTRLAA